MNVFNELEQRGFIYQVTDDSEIKRCLNDDDVRFYIGIDPTADSLHIGHLLPLMAARWLHACGHHPIILIGGGTAMVGDPSGKSSVRKILSKDVIEKNSRSLEKQIRGLFEDNTLPIFDSQNFGNVMIVNNMEWLSKLNYIDFLRDIGTYFSVNKMLSAESVQLRLKNGLSFLEFNYMLLQAYDFYMLSKNHGCKIQMGGQDQWGNIVAGTELTRRKLRKSAYGITVPLLTDAKGRKFGKTEGDAIWLDKQKTSVFDYYQFWRNADDSDVGKLLGLYTSLPQDEIKRLSRLKDSGANRAKEILAFEATCLAHGKQVAGQTFLSAGSRFGFADPEGKIETSSSISSVTDTETMDHIPTSSITSSDIGAGIWAVKLFVLTGLEKSNGAARRLITGGGAYINDTKIIDVDYEVQLKDFSDGQLFIRAGKKNVRKIKLK